MYLFHIIILIPKIIELSVAEGTQKSEEVFYMKTHVYRFLSLVIVVFTTSFVVPCLADETISSDKSNQISMTSGATITGGILSNTTQFDKYYNDKTGHGFAAEDANALDDVYSGFTVEKTGPSNELNGPDRIVNGNAIQTKYYDTAQNTLKSFFSKDGVLRYGEQLLEVPSDQYDEIITILEEKITRGELKDAKGNVITDVHEAKKLVKKGHYTYKQARNIARIGNIDSIKFDVRNNAISSTGVMGLTFAISTALSYWNGADLKTAAQQGLNDACATGLSTLAIGVGTSQILRTRDVLATKIPIRHSIKTVASTRVGKTMVEGLAKASSGKALHGAAATNHVAKVLRTTGVSNTIASVIAITPDAYRAAIRQSISWKQFGKNSLVAASSVVGGFSGTAAGGMIGATIGSVVPIVGTVAGTVIGSSVGGFVGAYITSSGTQIIADKVISDDSEEMLAIVETTAVNIAHDHLLLENEIETYSANITNVINADFLTSVFMAGRDESTRSSFAYKNLKHVATGIIQTRPLISIGDIERELLSSGTEQPAQTVATTQLSPKVTTSVSSFWELGAFILLITLICMSVYYIAKLTAYLLSSIVNVIVFVIKKLCVALFIITKYLLLTSLAAAPLFFLAYVL